MGRYTHFHGQLDFSRLLSRAELDILGQVIEAGSESSDAIEAAISAQAEAKRAGRGPLMFHGPDMAQTAARMGGWIVGDGLSPHYAMAMRISDDRRGLVYASEKTYDMVGGLNFIIANARARIPGFGLTGTLAADTEFAPYTWFVRIGPDGNAYGEPCTGDEFLAARRKLYPDGYCGFGMVDRQDVPAPPSRLRSLLNWLPRRRP